MQDDADHIHAAREGIGADAHLMIDAGTIFHEDVEAAAARLQALSDANVLWYEEPFDAAALELTVRSDLKGAQVFNLMAPDTMALETTDKLLAKYHPTTELRGDFSGYQSIFSSDHWLEVMGYKPQHLFDREKIRNAK